jgi:hypothetical protein
MNSDSSRAADLSSPSANTPGTSRRGSTGISRAARNRSS